MPSALLAPPSDDLAVAPSPVAGAALAFQAAAQGSLFAALADAPAPTAPVAVEQPTRRPKLTAEEKDERLQGWLRKLSEHQEYLAAHPEAQEQWLRALPHLHQYSMNNLWLIKFQRPDATRVAGFNAWKEQGRKVKKGEHGMFILRPQVARVPLKDPATGEPVLNSNGKPKTVSKVLPGRFAGAFVFDISQTEPMPGAEPTLAPERVQGATAAIDDALAVADRRGVRVLRGGGDDAMAQVMLLASQNAGGYYSAEDNTIVTRKGLSAEEEARVLWHELAHQELHSNQPGYQDMEDRRMKEVEAEGVAFAVLSDYGIAGDYSGHYISNWADGDPKRLHAAFQTIHNGAKALLTQRDDIGRSRSIETRQADQEQAV